VITSLFENVFEVLLGINIERTFVSLWKNRKLGLTVSSVDPLLLVAGFRRLIHSSIEIVIATARTHFIRVIITLLSVFSTFLAFL
jgi:hypothetical protein